MSRLADDVDGFLNSLKQAGGGALHELGVEQAREALSELARNTALPPQQVDRVDEHTIPVDDGEIRVRLYRPRRPDAEKPGLIMQCHGGGWVLGDMNTNDSLCRYYCNQVSALVMNVDYRLAPEFRFPIGLEDCYSALCWAVEQAESLGFNRERIAVTGDSAGANLATAVCLLSRQGRGPAIRYQALAYPAVDLTAEDENKYPSHGSYGGGEYFLTAGDIAWLKQNYLREDKDASNVLASPLLSEQLQELPPAFILTAGFDPLRDQGRAYAEKLEMAGVDVDYHCYAGTIHGFLSFAGVLESGRNGLEMMAEKIKHNLYK